jgi:hypothetical protein
MSAGHAANRDDVPAIDDAFYQRVKYLVDDCTRNRDHTIPWTANRSVDGRTVYIDGVVPSILPKTGIDTGQSLPYHELGEWLGMNEGDDYDTAHATKGNPCEKRRVEELGGIWDDYQAEIGEYVRLVSDEAMTSVPADIDKRVFIDDDDKAALEDIIADNKGFRMTAVRKFLQGAVVADTTLGERQIRVVASDPTIDRGGDIMVPDGCVLDNYKSNPIVLANHDSGHPIGNATPIIQNGRLEAIIDFAPKGISAKADEYCGLYKAGVLRAVSIGFDPLQMEPIKNGGVRYVRWELMELSCVSIPALPSALVIERSAAAARAAKADKREWKVGASLNLPIVDDMASGSRDRALAILDKAGTEWSWAKKGFLAYDPAAPADRKSYDLPFAEVVDGRMVVTRASLRAAAAGIPKLFGDLKDKAIAVINHYEAKMKTKIGAPKIKGLYDCASLASLLSELGWIHNSALWESEVEQDGSKLPAMLADLMKQCAEALIAMTAEETAELLEGHGIDVLPDDEAYVAAAPTPQAKALRAAFRKAAHVKAGRALSEANLGHMVEMHKCFGKMADCLTKAADLHDDLHDEMTALADHGTSAGEHHKAIMKSAGKKPDGSDCDEDVADPTDADNELAAEADERKRLIDVMERSAA